MSIGKKFLFFLKIKIYFFCDWIKTVNRYYSNIQFMFFDICFNFIYLFFNPYRISRRYLEKKLHKKIYDYGETSLIEIEKIIKNFKIQPNSKILELGAGRGKVSFWLYFFYNCHITAIEQIPFFIKMANFFKKIWKMENIKFLCKDFYDYEFENFDFIYLYGTTLNDEKIKILINKFKKLLSVKIITISYSLNEYDDNFICIKDFDITFPWGKTKVYLNIKKAE